MSDSQEDELKVISRYMQGGITEYSIDGGKTFHNTISLAIAFMQRELTREQSESEERRIAELTKQSKEEL